MSNKTDKSMNQLVEQLVRRSNSFPTGRGPQPNWNSGNNFGRTPGPNQGGGQGPRRSSSTFFVVGLVIWSALAWFGYLAADGLLAWLASSSGTLLDAGKNVGTAFGAKEVGVAIDSLGVEGWIGSLISLVQALLAPMFVVIWLVGAAVLFALPRILGWLATVVGGRN